jgi:stage V sporulation protein S
MGLEELADPIEIKAHEENVLRVTAGANPKELAAVISYAVYDNGKPIMRCIGAGAVNQAFKAYIIARGYVATRGLDLYLKGGFATVQGDAGEISAVTMQVFAT